MVEKEESGLNDAFWVLSRSTLGPEARVSNEAGEKTELKTRRRPTFKGVENIMLLWSPSTSWSTNMIDARQAQLAGSRGVAA